MFMTNIPRRKIYETMLIFEDGLIDMNVLIYSEQNFTNYLDKFNLEHYPKIIKSYHEIICLLIMFLENKKYEKEHDFQAHLKYLLSNKKEVDEEIKKDKNLQKEFKVLCKEIEKTFEENKTITDLKMAKEFFVLLDKFNTQIPLILTIRRDKMK